MSLPTLLIFMHRCSLELKSKDSAEPTYDKVQIINKEKLNDNVNMAVNPSYDSSTVIKMDVNPAYKTGTEYDYVDSIKSCS